MSVDSGLVLKDDKIQTLNILSSDQQEYIQDVSKQEKLNAEEEKTVFRLYDNTKYIQKKILNYLIRLKTSDIIEIPQEI